MARLLGVSSTFISGPLRGENPGLDGLARSVQTLSASGDRSNVDSPRSSGAGPLAALLARRVRRALGQRLARVVADRGFTSRASVGALAASGVPFSLGVARSAASRRAGRAVGCRCRRRWRRGGVPRSRATAAPTSPLRRHQHRGGLHLTTPDGRAPDRASPPGPAARRGSGSSARRRGSRGRRGARRRRLGRP
jgi:hypothetical protein